MLKYWGELLFSVHLLNVVKRNSYNLNMDQSMRASNHTLLVHRQIYSTEKRNDFQQAFILLLETMLMNKYV